ncbi:MAG: hypothetical protein U0559_00120 [Anaerolineae bacterium]
MATLTPQLTFDGALRLRNARRLVVLVPDQQVDDAALAKRVWSLAVSRRLAVTYLGLARDVDAEMRLRRELSLLLALTRDDRLTVDARPVAGRSWLKALQSEVRPGDVLVCMASHQIHRWGRKDQSAAQMIEMNGVYPVLELRDVPIAVSERPSRLQLMWQAVPLVIIGGFFQIQVLIAQAARDWPRTALLCISVGAEVGLIWMWESFRA